MHQDDGVSETGDSNRCASRKGPDVLPREHNRSAEPMTDPRLRGGTRVSVIINNYNYGHFLGAAIDSALTQTYAPIEVVVVDDGSTDDSRNVIAGYGSRIRAVLKVNGGQASAFNAGFAASTGAVIAAVVVLPPMISFPRTRSSESSRLSRRIRRSAGCSIPSAASSTMGRRYFLP